MPALITIVTPKGSEPAPYSAESLADAVRYEPYDGVYTVTNTYHVTQVLKFDAHLDRLEDSARRAGISLHLDRARLRAALRQLILDAGFGDVRFRITVPRESPDHIILTIEPYAPPSDALVHTGVRVITVANSARHNAAAKTNDWMHDRDAIEKSLPPGVYTALLCDENDDVLEGVSSNFYALLDGELRTAGANVLPGIARQIVFEVAPEIVPLRQEAIRRDDITRISEAFVTSSSRGMLPVVEIDSHLIGDGKPGAVTMQLRAAYTRWAEVHLEEL